MTPGEATAFDDLVAAVCHGLATEEEMRALSTRLAEDPEARAAYLRQVDLHASLAADDTLFSFAGEADGEGGGLRMPLPTLDGEKGTAPARPATSRTLLTLAALLVASLVLAALFLRERASPEGKDDVVKEGAATEEEIEVPAALASITRLVDARWRGLEPPSDLAEPRLLELASGLAQIECGTGAVIVAEGPLKAELLSDSALRLEHGKVRVQVPPQASGFTLYTPDMKIVDQGTDFAVLLEADGLGEIHVFEGAVEVVPESGKKNETESLVAGDARTFDFRRGGRRLVPRPVNPSAFLGIREIDERASALRLHQFKAWQAHIEALAEDPSLRALFTFASHESWDRTVRNLAPERRKPVDGALVGCQWTRGRWSEKDALDFHRPADRLRVHLGGTCEAFTLMAWIYLPAHPPLRPRTLFSAAPPAASGPRSPEWQLVREGGMTLNLRRTLDDKSLVFRQNDALPGTGWTHVAVTCTREPSGEDLAVRFYVNGQAFETQRARSDGKFALGRCDIGNSVPPPRENLTPEARKKAARSGSFPFIGLLDEFALLTRTLGPDEVAANWRAGAPLPIAE